MKKLYVAVVLSLAVGLLVRADDAPPSKITAAVVPVPRPKPVEWSEVKCDPGVPVVLSVEGAKITTWLLVDDTGATLTTVPDSQSAVFATTGRTRHRVIAIADGKLNLTVMVAGDAPPGPPPGPTPPVPPKPVDELTKQLQAAYDADKGDTKAADLKQLIGLYTEAAVFAKDAKFATANDLFEAVRAAAGSLLPDVDGVRRLAGLRKVIAGELASVLPTDQDAPLTEAVRSAASAAFAKYAKALQGVVAQ